MAPITDLSQLDLTKTYTYADYYAWQFNERVELIKGYVRPIGPSPRRMHQAVSRDISCPIWLHLNNQHCEIYASPFDVRLSTGGRNGDSQITTVVQPDICVVCDPQKLDERGCLGAPDWIIEIVSPRTLVYDTKTKFDLYEEAGVSEYWIAFPGEKSVAAYVLREGRYELVDTYYEPGPMPAHTLPELGLTWERVFGEA